MTAIYEPKGRAAEYAALAINQYIGCNHGCRYCYAANLIRQMGMKVGEVRPGKNVIESLRKQATKFAGDKRRVLLSFLSDPYPTIESDHRLTQTVIKILKDHKISFQVLTKAGMRAVSDFVYYGLDDMFATTLTFPDDRRSLEWEPGAALPQGRIESLEMAKDMGIKTWVSIEPVIDPAASLEAMEMAAPWVDLFKIGKLNHRTNDTDWRAFGIAAIELCRRWNKPFFIKHDLAAHLNGFDYANTDTRSIE